MDSLPFNVKVLTMGSTLFDNGVQIKEGSTRLVQDLEDGIRLEININLKKRVLLIDDDEITLRILSRYFSSLDCQVTTLQSSVDAITTIQKHSFDLIITDLNMSLLTGTDICDYIKDLKLQTPTIILTSYVMKDTRNYTVYKKPMTIENVKEIISVYLK